MMRKERNFQWIGWTLLLVSLALASGCKPAVKQATVQTNCQRIVSLSPGVTEVLYNLELGERVVGVTRFCTYPAEAKKKPKVGGYLDPDMEAVLRLRPDLVVMRKEQADIAANILKLGIPVLQVEHRTVPGILNSFRQIGQTCHREQAAERQLAMLDDKIRKIRRDIQAGGPKPKVLITVDRDTRNNGIRDVYIAGHEGFYDWIIEQAGGANAWTKDAPAFPQVSVEGILRMNPDVIVELMPTARNGYETETFIRLQWANYPRIQAVKNGRVHLFNQDYMVIPGPRFYRILEEMVRVMHPGSAGAFPERQAS